MSDFAASLERSGLGRWFSFAEKRTTLARDTIAGMTTFIVMSYIIFVNPAILVGRCDRLRGLFAIPIMQQEFSWI